jgi:ATP-dependent Lon protease
VKTGLPLYKITTYGNLIIMIDAPTSAEEVSILRQKADLARLPDSVRDRIQTQIDRLARLTGSDYTMEADRTSRWVDWIVTLPWESRVAGHLDLTTAKEILDKHHHGLEEVKTRLLEYLSVLKLRQTTNNQQPAAIPDSSSFQHPVSSMHQFRAPILLLVGLVGTGKTTLAYSIAEALGRPLVRIPFGGIGSAKDLRGQSRLHLEAEPGQIIKALRQVKVKNPIMLLDELDRVADSARHDIMGVLVELLDPEQNKAFLDHYLDVPFDLSEIFFITTANNIANIATAVMDRLEPISMPSYTDEDKITIAKNYLLPRAVADAKLPDGSLVIEADVWPHIVRPLGYDAGIRTLQRTIQGLVLKTAFGLVTGQRQILHLTTDNYRQYITTW